MSEPESSGQQASTTMRNVLTEEKATAGVVYAITGDAEVDAIAGVLAVLREQRMPVAGILRILDYLHARFAAQNPTDMKKLLEQARLRQEYNEKFPKMPISPAAVAPPFGLGSIGGGQIAKGALGSFTTEELVRATVDESKRECE